MHRFFPPPPTASPAERFAAILEWLGAVIFRGNTQPLLPRVTFLIHRLMSRYRQRFIDLAARVAAGRKPRVQKPCVASPGLPHPRAPGTADAPPRPQRPRVPAELPHGPNWMCHLVPMYAVTAGGMISYLLEEPETKALVLSHPDFAPMLRCLLRMLGGNVPVWLRLPPRAKRVPGAAPESGATTRRRRAGKAGPADPPLEPLRPLDKRYRIPRSWKVPRSATI